ncbi:response regulator [soil metagenome]
MSARVLLLSVDGPAQQAVTDALKESGATLTVLDNVAAAAEQTPAHQLVIVEAASNESVGRLLRILSQSANVAGPARPRFLAIAHSDSIEQRVALLEQGADDVVVQPFDPRELEAMVEALLLQAAPPRRAVEKVPDADVSDGGRQEGQVYLFAAAKGGVGSTALAVNTCLALLESVRSGVALADLDFHHGQVATFLDVRAPTTTADLARDDVALADDQLLWQSGVEHSSGVHVFAAPSRPDLGAAIDHVQAVTLLTALRRAFSLVVIDAGSVLDWRSLALIGAADRVVITLTPEIPSLRVLHGALEVLSEGETDTERTLFVLNNTYPQQRVTAEQIEEHLGVTIALQVPYDPELFLTAANEGKPIMIEAPRSPQAQAFRRLAGLLRGETDGPPAAAAQDRRRRLGSLLKRG